MTTTKRTFLSLGFVTAAACAVACSDPKPPASQAAFFGEFVGSSCGDNTQNTISYGEPNVSGGARVTDGEGDYEVTCRVYETEGGYRVAATVSGGARTLHMSGNLEPVTGQTTPACDEVAAGGFAGPVDVIVGLQGRNYSDDAGSCWASVGNGDVTNGKIRGNLCCSTVTGTPTSRVCSTNGARFVFENCDVGG